MRPQKIDRIFLEKLRAKVTPDEMLEELSSAYSTGIETLTPSEISDVRKFLKANSDKPTLIPIFFEFLARDAAFLSEGGLNINVQRLIVNTLSSGANPFKYMSPQDCWDLLLWAPPPLLSQLLEGRGDELLSKLFHDDPQRVIDKARVQQLLLKVAKILERTENSSFKRTVIAIYDQLATHLGVDAYRDALEHAHVLSRAEEKGRNRLLAQYFTLMRACLANPDPFGGEEVIQTEFSESLCDVLSDAPGCEHVARIEIAESFTAPHQTFLRIKFKPDEDGVAGADLRITCHHDGDILMFSVALEDARHFSWLAMRSRGNVWQTIIHKLWWSYGDGNAPHAGSPSYYAKEEHIYEGKNIYCAMDTLQWLQTQPDKLEALQDANAMMTVFFGRYWDVSRRRRKMQVIEGGSRYIKLFLPWLFMTYQQLFVDYAHASPFESVLEDGQVIDAFAIFYECRDKFKTRYHLEQTRLSIDEPAKVRLKEALKRKTEQFLGEKDSSQDSTDEQREIAKMLHLFSALIYDDPWRLFHVLIQNENALDGLRDDGVFLSSLIDRWFRAFNRDIPEGNFCHKLMCCWSSVSDVEGKCENPIVFLLGFNNFMALLAVHIREAPFNDEIAHSLGSFLSFSRSGSAPTLSVYHHDYFHWLDVLWKNTSDEALCSMQAFWNSPLFERDIGIAGIKSKITLIVLKRWLVDARNEQRVDGCPDIMCEWRERVTTKLSSSSHTVVIQDKPALLLHYHDVIAHHIDFIQAYIQHATYPEAQKMFGVFDGVDEQLRLSEKFEVRPYFTEVSAESFREAEEQLLTWKSQCRQLLEARTRLASGSAEGSGVSVCHSREGVFAPPLAPPSLASRGDESRGHLGAPMLSLGNPFNFDDCSVK